MLRALLLAFILAAPNTRAAAQALRLQILAGGAVSGGIAKAGSTTHSSVLLPRIGAGIRIRVTDRVSLLSGLDLQQKGFRSHIVYEDEEPGDGAVVDAVSRYTQLHLPLQLSWSVAGRKAWALELSGGMSYGFMLRARSDWEWATYRHGRNVHTEVSQTTSKISLLPYDNRITNARPWTYSALYLFNPAFAGAITLQYRRHLLLHLFGEYNLYDASSVSQTPMRLYSVGACIGYRF